MTKPAKLLEHADTLHRLALNAYRLGPRDLRPSHLEDKLLDALGVPRNAYGRPCEALIPALRAARHIDDRVGAYSVTDQFSNAMRHACAAGRALDVSRYIWTIDLTLDALILDLGLNRPHVAATNAELEELAAIQRHALDVDGVELVKAYRLNLVDVAGVLLTTGLR